MVWTLDRKGLREKLSFILNMNPKQTNQDFIGPTGNTNKYLDEAINEAYRAVVNEAMLECGYDWFKRVYSFTWAADADTQQVPDDILGKDILELRDTTDDEMGTPLVFCDYWVDGAIHWEDRKTLRWGTTGPSRITTISAVCLENPQDLVSDNDEPFLIPVRFRDIISWKAAILLRTMADELAPESWILRFIELQEQLHTTLARGKPSMNNPSRIRISDPYEF